jgi:hypothetical protein
LSRATTARVAAAGGAEPFIRTQEGKLKETCEPTGW